MPAARVVLLWHHDGVVTVSFLGLRTEQFDQMKRLYVEGYALPVLHEAHDVVWFELDDGAELHVYAVTDEFHSFFTDGPVPGLFVSDYDEVAARLPGLGVRWLTDLQTARGRRWRHYRAPDGNVYELMGPAADG